MAYIGLTFLIASISFLCYRYPPSSWISSSWMAGLLNRVPESIAPKTIAKEDESVKVPRMVEDEKTVTKEQDDKIVMPPPPIVANQEDDRKAMPPPHPPFKTAPSSPTTPKANASSSMGPPPIPCFAQDDYPNAPSFPAANSAQRAQGGKPGLPRLRGLPVQPNTGGLMAPPSRGPLPNRNPQTSSSNSLLPPPSHSAIPTKPRKKVLLTPGHSPLDWARVSSSPTANLRGLPPSTPFLRVPPSLLKQMTGRKEKDAWTVLGGKVYNMTPYLPYHPGGEPELMKAAGRDGTRLFGEVHPWVNYEGMMEGCLVGIAVEEGDVRASALEEMD
ncbi:hypothetical protein BJ878DRAFT_414666 [Calycina marina]|uniref:Cytochrome b5 heme-binding domain-containing protein n=1 Tax=Calycina marina TaxID=1763456 RepID=A0A9P7Z8Y9_9HELO|nr:hypothetical protein BJ878DRAFT_414666 [Calycina marina]